MDRLSLEDMKNSIESLLTTLKCPVCLVLLEEESILCVNGHAICMKCKRDQGECPTCRDKFSNVNKNMIVRQVLGNVPHICRYEKCSYLVKSGEDHEIYCRYRPTQCKYPNCDWEGSADNIAYHLEDSHPGEKVLPATKSLVQISKNNLKSKVISLLSACNHYFWQIADQDKITGSLYLTYYPLFLAKPTRDIYMRIWFKSEEKEYDAGVKIRMNQIDDDKGDCFTIPSSLVSHFYFGDKLKYHLFIDDEREEVINMLLE